MLCALRWAYIIYMTSRGKCVVRKQDVGSTNKDSSDEECAAHDKSAASTNKGAKATAERRETAILDKAAVLAAVQGMASSNPMRLPSIFGDESVRNAWEAWHRDAPTSLADIPAERRAAATFAMPVKCGAAVAGGPVVPTQRAQVELLSFQNSGGERAGITQQEVQRSATAQLKPTISAADVPVGSIVALRNLALESVQLGTRWKLHVGKGRPRQGKGISCPKLVDALLGSLDEVEFSSADVARLDLPQSLRSDSWIEVPNGVRPAFYMHNILRPGEGTEFLIGDVVAIEHEEPDSSGRAPSGAAGASADTRGVARVLVHYRMPVGGSGFCDNVNSEWKRACLCRQEYTKAHERGRACRAFKDTAVGSASHDRDTVAYVDWQPADRIFETDLGPLNASQSLPAEAKVRIAGSNSEWKRLLGVKDKAQGKKRKAA